MSLPRKIVLSFLSLLVGISIFSILPAAVLGSHNQDRESQNTIQPLPTPTPEDSEIRPIPKPSGDDQVRQIAWSDLNPLSWPGNLANFFKGKTGAAVEGAVYVTEDTGTKQVSGCSSLEFQKEVNYSGVESGAEKRPPIPTTGGAECYQGKLNAYLDGKTLGEIPNPGLLDYVAAVTSESLTLPVPIDSGQYFASINPFAEARAQESGVAGLANNSIVLGVWRSVRNVSYALSAVVLIIIGFMIMIRWKLDPRTVVTIQNSLPRIVVSLILITFSFAISGFLIDLTRLITDVVMSIVSFPGETIIGLIAIGSMALVGLAGFFFFPPSGFLVLFLLLLSLILAVMMLVIFIIISYKILMRYVTFVLLTIFSPLFFLAGALPGGEGLVLNWFKRQAAALMAIPAVALFLNLSFKFGFEPFTTGEFDFPSPAGTADVYGPIDSILGFILISPLIGIGILFFTTKVPDMVDELFGIKEMGARKGIGPGGIIGMPAGAMQQVGGFARSAQHYAGSNLPGASRVAKWFPPAAGGKPGKGVPPRDFSDSAGDATTSGGKGRYARHDTQDEAIAGARRRIQERDQSGRKGSSRPNTPNTNENPSTDNPPEEGGGAGGAPT